jgi:hypothetical protein
MLTPILGEQASRGYTVMEENSYPTAVYGAAMFGTVLHLVIEADLILLVVFSCYRCNLNHGERHTHYQSWYGCWSLLCRLFSGNHIITSKIVVLVDGIRYSTRLAFKSD